MELVLGQQSSPSSDSAPETVITDPPSETADPPDLTAHLSTLTSDPPTTTLTPDLPAAQSEAPPTETTPTETDVQDEDQVKPEQGAWKTWKFYCSCLSAVMETPWKQENRPGKVFNVSAALLSFWSRPGTRRRSRPRDAGPLCLT